MNYLNAIGTLVGLLLALGMGTLFVSSGRQKGKSADAETAMAELRDVNTDLRNEITDKDRRLTAAEASLLRCHDSTDSLKRELDALGKVITAEAHIVALQDMVAEALSVQQQVVRQLHELAATDVQIVERLEHVADRLDKPGGP